MLRLSALLFWRPNDRELRLLLACGGALLAYGWSASYDELRESIDNRARAAERLAKVRSDTMAMASLEHLQALSDQKMNLAALSMFDATPAISQLRMQEELVDLATRAGLANLTVVEELSGQTGAEAPSSKTAYSAIVTTIEAEFDWAAMATLIGQIEQYKTGYLLERLEMREDGKARRMRAGFRILHRNVGPST